MGLRFLNVDLEITSRSKLDALAEELGDRIGVLFIGKIKSRYRLSFEISGVHRDPDSTILSLCRLIESLSKESRARWDAANKVFDLGFESSEADCRAAFSLRRKTVQAISQLSAEIGVTVYPFVPDS